MSKPTLYLYLVALMGLTCVACTQGTVYNQYMPTSLKGWERNDTILFQTDTMPETGDYLEEIGMRIKGDYPFMGISLIVEQTVIPSGKSYKDTLSCQLINEKGNIMGDGINHYQYLFPHTTLKLNKGESVRVAIYHCMKREMLPGISDIGLKLSR